MRLKLRPVAALVSCLKVDTRDLLLIHKVTSTLTLQHDALQEFVGMAQTLLWTHLGHS